MAQYRTWADLPRWTEPFRGTDQVLLIAGTGGAKSTLVATVTLPVTSLIALDEKASLALPNARIVDLPFVPRVRDGGERVFPADFLRTLDTNLALREGADNRVIVRPHPRNLQDADVHDAIFRVAFHRGDTVVWVDEITATGASANTIPPWYMACSARGRTRGIGLWSCSQSPFGLVPLILRRNAHYVIFGSLEPGDIENVHRPHIEIAATIPRSDDPSTPPSERGRFLLYKAGYRDPWALQLPIPPALRGWSAP